MDNGSNYFSGEIKFDGFFGEFMEFNVDGGRVFLEGEEVIFNFGSLVVLVVNDIFWE